MTVKAQKTARHKPQVLRSHRYSTRENRRIPVGTNMSPYNDTFDTSNVCTAPLGKYDQNLLPLKYVSLWLTY